MDCKLRIDTDLYRNDIYYFVVLSYHYAVESSIMQFICVNNLCLEISKTIDSHYTVQCNNPICNMILREKSFSFYR